MAKKTVTTGGAAAGARRVAGGTIRVRATQVGVYDDVRRRVGDVFDLHPRTGPFSKIVRDKEGEPKTTKGTLLAHPVTEDVEQTLSAEDQFSAKWMERVAADTPARARSAQEVIQDDHDRVLRQRMGGEAPAAGEATGDENVLGD